MRFLKRAEFLSYYDLPALHSNPYDHLVGDSAPQSLGIQGNIHLHVAFNSLRIKDIPSPEYSDLARDCKAGYKYQASDERIRYLKADLERMCRERRLSQIPLNQPAKKKVTNQEYWAGHRGQERLNQKNEAIRSIGGKPTETKFQTELNLILKNLGVYHKFRPLYQEYLKTRKSPKFKEQHIRKVLLYEGARKFLREYQEGHKIKSFPAMQMLRTEKAELTAQQQQLYDRRKELKQSIKVMEDGYRLLEQAELMQRNPTLNRYVER